MYRYTPLVATALLHCDCASVGVSSSPLLLDASPAIVCLSECLRVRASGMSHCSDSNYWTGLYAAQ